MQGVVHLLTCTCGYELSERKRRSGLDRNRSKQQDGQGSMWLKAEIMVKGEKWSSQLDAVS
jgi:hypothetical protein